MPTAARASLIAYADALEMVVALSRTLIDNQTQSAEPDHSQCQAGLEELVQDNSRMSDKLRELISESSQLHHKKTELEEEIGARNSQIDGMFETAKEKAARIQELEAELLAARTDLDKAGEMNAKITEERDQLAEHINVANHNEQTATNQWAELQVKLDAANMKLARAEKALADAPAPGKDETERIELLEKEVQTLRGLNNDKSKELKTERAQRKALESKVAELHEAREEALTDREEAEQGAPGVVPEPAVRKAKSALGRATRLLTAENDDYAFEPEDRVVLLLTEALEQLEPKEKK